MAYPNEKGIGNGFPTNIEIERTEHHQPSRQYLATRFTTLKPPMAKPPNPIRLLRMLNLQQWLFFLVAFLAWTWDAFDFFTVSLTVEPLAEDFGKTNKDITWGITLVLMLRSVGAIIFGIASDRYGRKWPFIINNLLFIVLELATGFCQTYEQFLAVRALFGIAMGGLYGNAAATALEDCPQEARGLLSGLLQQGYAFGYLLATAFARALVDTTPHGWRPLFWFGACPPILIILFRLCLPETAAFRSRVAARKTAQGHSNSNSNNPTITRTFLQEGHLVLRQHWRLLIYLVLLMAGFNFMSHGSQDLYPTLLSNQFDFSRDAVTITQVIANVGAITGGTVVGYTSQILGRRLCIIAMAILGAALLYPYTHTASTSSESSTGPVATVVVAAFFQQFCVQGAWGVIPIHLLELSPDSMRTFVVGTSYQLGNLISSASSTIEAKLGEGYPLPPKIVDGDVRRVISRYDYGRVVCVFMAVVYAYVLVLVVAGPERRGRDLDSDRDGLADVDGGNDREMRGERDDTTKVDAVVKQQPQKETA